ncbi:MAG TPA: hypothetical protein DCQ36_05240, partial [Actinobacteria bacterium]|nr:hypothetical protein [Actinomycetota bacterium]
MVLVRGQLRELREEQGGATRCRRRPSAPCDLPQADPRLVADETARIIRVPVHRRFSDLDPLGHVNNVVFHDYLQEARVGLLRDLDFVRGEDFSQVVVKQEITHRKPLMYAPEPVIVEIWVDRIGNSSYTLGYRILDEV